MDLMYIVFSFALAIFNLFRALNGMNVMNFVFAALWLVIGIVLSVRYRNRNKINEEE